VRGKGAALKSGVYSRLVRRGEYQRSMDVVQQERYDLRRQLGNGNHDIVLGGRLAARLASS
jgi:hypothetical protein